MDYNPNTGSTTGYTIHSIPQSQPCPCCGRCPTCGQYKPNPFTFSATTTGTSGVIATNPTQ